MLTSKRPSSSSSKVADAFAGDVAPRLLPVAGFAKFHAALYPKILKLPALELRAYAVLVLLCDGWKKKEDIPLVRTEDLCELLEVTRRRVLLAIAELARKGLVRPLTPAQAHGGKQYQIVQPGEHPSVIEKDHSALHPHGSPRITEPSRSVIPPLPSEGVDTLWSSRSDLSVPSSSLEISEPPSHPQAGGGGEAIEIPKSWSAIARRIFPRCHSPERFLTELVEHGFDEEDGCSYLEKAAKAADLPPEDHRALAAWCSAERRAEWLDRRRRQQLRLVRTNAPTSVVDVPVLSARQLADRARAALNALSTSESAPGDTGPAKVALNRSSPEQSANFEGTVDVAEGGSR